MQTVELTDDLFQGHISLERGDGFVRPWRIPFDRHPLYIESPETGMGPSASRMAGVRLRFATDADRVDLLCVPTEPTPEQQPRTFDLVRENEILQTVALAPGEERAVFSDLPGGEAPLEIWLPPAVLLQLRRLEVEGGALRPAPDTRFRWVTYGSSITHCGSAHSPARTWPATVARARDWHLTCLGYGGQCHLDSMIARMIRDREADFISIKAGINIYGRGSLNLRTFLPAIIGSVEIIREKHPATPLLLISPILSPHRETTENAVGFTLEGMRAEVEEAFRRLKEVNGDEHLYYASGLELFGPEIPSERLPDNLHPDGDGYEIMGRNFLEKVLPRVDPSQTTTVP